LAARDVAQGLAEITRAVDNGADPRQLARELVDYVRGLMFIKSGGGSALTLTAEAQVEMNQRAQEFTSEQIVRAIRLFNQAAFELRTSSHPTLPLEIAYVEATLEDAEPKSRVIAPSVPPAASSPKNTPLPSREAPPPARPKTESRSAAPPKSMPIASGAAAVTVQAQADSVPVAVTGTLTVDTLRGGWRNVLARVRPYDKMAEALLRDAEPLRVEGDLIVLGFFHQVHAERFEKQPNSKAMIEKALSEIFQQKCRVKCILSPKKARLKAAEEDPLIRAAINQMGAEITEIHD
jgi:DNA polymerase-3 subunit gamma/tau